MRDTYKIEITDTFAGEANYSWVRRYEFTMPQGCTDLALVRAAKRLAGWEGVRCSRNKYNGDIELRPRGECVVMFITFTGELK